MKADNHALQHGGLDPSCDKRHAIIVVRGEKEICHFFINLYAKLEPLLNAAATVADRRLAIARYRSDSSDLGRFIHSACEAVNHRALQKKTASPYALQKWLEEGGSPSAVNHRASQR